MIDKLPDELRDIIAAETIAPVATEAAQLAVRAKLGASLGIAPVAAAAPAAVAAPAAAAATVKTALSIKLLSIVVGVAVVGGSAAVVVSSRAPKPVRSVPVASTPSPTVDLGPTAPEPVAVEPAVVEAPASEPPVVERAAPIPAVAASRPPVSPKKPAVIEVPPHVEPPPAAPVIRTQSQLLADASRALSTGDPERTLALVDEDLRAHGNGPLAEDREALRVSALLALGRSADARAAARRLLAAYPQTIHRALVDRALTEKESR